MFSKVVNLYTRAKQRYIKLISLSKDWSGWNIVIKRENRNEETDGCMLQKSKIKFTDELWHYAIFFKQKNTWLANQTDLQVDVSKSNL